MKSIKHINIKNRPYYFFNDMINIKNFDSNFSNIDKISFKSTDAVIYKFRYFTMKSFDHVNIDSENPLYLIFNNVDGYIECNSIEESKYSWYDNSCWICFSRRQQVLSTSLF